ncbi:hypothetical protein BK712_29160 [Bacillus thuringiensis serovar seoulensis]|nr:hypothetical protein BK712_29160 [Bacillus thuringiensis serovar seoulensis]
MIYYNSFGEINQYIFCSLCIKGEIIIGGYGYRFRAGEESGFSATSPNGYGGGVSFKFEKESR